VATTLIIGASGTVGSEIASLLASRGHTLRRATSQAPTAADQVQLDLTTGQGAVQALQGADSAFMLAPPGHVNQDQLLNPLIDLAREHGVKKLVLMTAMGANASEEAPLRKAELHLQNSGLAYNIIRPNWFMQNFNSFWLQGILQQGKILLPVGKGKGSFIDARDIAAVATELLTRTEFDNCAFDLTGPRALDHDEVAAILSREIGKPVVFQDIAPAAMLEGLLQAGLPRPYAEFMLMILDYFKLGYSERTTPAVAEITGRQPRTIEQYAKDYRSAWLN
jgi:uncharacterized protein YbjT (DUF2867 family)